MIYNESTGQWVMWVHSDGPESPTSTSTYARAEAGVAVSDSPTGPFRWIDSYRLDRVPSDSVPWCGSGSAFDPAGGMARDMNLFVDEDGTGYIVAPCHNLQSCTPLDNVLAMYDEIALSGEMGG